MTQSDFISTLKSFMEAHRHKMRRALTGQGADYEALEQFSHEHRSKINDIFAERTISGNRWKVGQSIDADEVLAYHDPDRKLGIAFEDNLEEIGGLSGHTVEHAWTHGYLVFIKVD